MNVLSFNTDETDGIRTIEFLIDGCPINELINSANAGIPFWLFENDLPHFPPLDGDSHPDSRLVCVCSCGEYGCGNARCKHQVINGIVHWSEFSGDVPSDSPKIEFQFTLDNYNRVVSEVLTVVRSYGANEP